MPLLSGRILLPDETVEGWMLVEDGILVDWDEGAPDERPDAEGWIAPPLVNAHTHVADAFLRGARGMPTSIPELVGPGGWKHRQLAMARRERAGAGVVRYAGEMAEAGCSHFIDFRENGLTGTRFLRDLRDQAEWTDAEGLPPLPAEPLIFGRPAMHDWNPEEAEEILPLVDGIGLSGVRDFPEQEDLAAWAEAALRAGKPWAVHLSEDRHDALDSVIGLEPDHIVHMVHAMPGDLRMAAELGLPIVSCPRSNAFFGQKPPLREMLDAGCLVAFGTDNGMLQDGDLWEEAALARRLVPGIDDDTLLRMMSHHGRIVAGLPKWELRKGKPVDAVVFDANPFPVPGMERPPVAFAS